MVADPSESRTSSQAGWLSGLVLGFVNGLALLAIGTVGSVLLAATVLLIAWKGPRLVATAGLMTGAGLIWTVLFLNVALSCAATNATPGRSCDAGDIWAWVAATAAIFVTGLVGSAFAFRRSRMGR